MSRSPTSVGSFISMLVFMMMMVMGFVVMIVMVRVGGNHARG